MKSLVNPMRRIQSSARRPQGPEIPEAYWSLPAEQLLSALHSSRDGLSPAEAQQRLAQYGPNTIAARQQATVLGLLWKQFTEPAGDHPHLCRGGLLGAGRMDRCGDRAGRGAGQHDARLCAGVPRLQRRGKAALAGDHQVHRAARRQAADCCPSEQVAPGDVVLLSAGSLIPADGVVLEATDLFVNQAVLTGETFPVEKAAGSVCRHRPAWQNERIAS